MKPYKLKHIPTGLYYQPQKYRGSNLSKLGKVYQTANHGLVSSFKKDEFYVYVHENSIIFKLLIEYACELEKASGYKEYRLKTFKKDWEISEI